MKSTIDAGGATAGAGSGESQEEFTRIGDMAKQFDVTLRTLRFYEDKGLLNPHREGATRLYTRRDRARMKLIMLGRKVGFSLRDVKQLMDLYDPTGPNTRQMKLALDKSEKQLVRLHKQRAALDEAVGELEDLIGTLRGRLSGQPQPSRKLQN
ncbi:MAG TPA: MerR family DNA-binding transcriptional regulator [Mesorhizobium sp.]|jgi:DNA-binding transcriptional MerR regulator|nr:MerR family DNA-binding transcriptional regulator [Mesorhizobium sp.]